MNKIYKNFRKAFSLLELSICILIVSVIIVVCVPVITNQMKKTDEYSYFLGYKTVEKLGSQIVALGDPGEAGGSWNLKHKAYIDDDVNVSRRAANRIDKLSRHFIPKAQAQSLTILSWPSYEYEMARLCNGNTHVIIDYKDLAGNILTPERFLGEDPTEAQVNAWLSANCDGYYRNTQNPNRLKLRFGCNDPEHNIHTSIVDGTVQFGGPDGGTELTAQQFCYAIGQECQMIYSGYNVQYEYKTLTLNQATNMSQYGQCIVYIPGDESEAAGASGSSSTDTLSLSTSNTLCNGLGYFNVGTSTLQNLCACSPANPSPSVNHPNICCPTPTAGYVSYSDREGNCVTNSGGGYGCRVGAYNEKTGECCPDNAYYGRTVGNCACQQGFKPETDDEGNLSCTAIDTPDCPFGYHLVEEEGKDPVCIVNLPIIKASRFCELIVNNYNVASSNCGTFSAMVSYPAPVEPVSYNEALFNAITTGETQYLSSLAVEGAFNGLTPNIVFSNGLKLWILGDKVASIAGLSFDPTGYEPNINACVDRKVYTKADCDDAGDNHYFCNGTNNCFTLENGESAGKLQDARSCCPTVDYTDLIGTFVSNTYLTDSRVYAISGFTVFVDITGDKDLDQGGGTLWKDVFPFYVGSDGTVYPGYPLNAVKSDISLYQGGNGSALNSDVYYYDVVDGDGEGGKVRKKRMAYSSIPYSRALCFSLKVSAYTPYCQNLGDNFRGRNKSTYPRIDQYIYSDSNPCWKHRCYIHVKNKIKFL